jgi:hypothetical protein
MNTAGATGAGAPLVVQYLFLHAPGDDFVYPSARAGTDARRLAARYLECVAVQAASLRFSGADCDPVLVTNLEDPAVVLDHRGARLLDVLDDLGVRRVTAPYDHAPRRDVAMFHASRYVFDAILATAPADAPQRPLWMVDVDCVWRHPARAFAALPGAADPGAVGCVTIGYPPGWDVSGQTRESIGALAGRLGDADPVPPWIGGELLAGTAAALRDLVGACERLDDALDAAGVFLATEEQLLTAAGALGRMRFADRSDLAGRIWTGPRHQAANPANPAALALWHLPSEKGLGFRRAARALATGRTGGLQRDLADTERALRRFNIAGGGLRTRLRNDGWLAAQRLRAALSLP